MNRKTRPLPKPQVLIFDLGNTLVPLGHGEIEAELDWWHRQWQNAGKASSEFPRELLRTLRRQQILRPYNSDYRENDPLEVIREIMNFLELATAQIAPEALRQEYDQWFAGLLALPAGRLDFLKELRNRYQLALLSNYPSAPAIRYFLDSSGLAELFTATVISGDLGIIKPHPRIFSHLVEILGVLPSDCWFIGDNWLADIQGAARAGMTAVLTCEYVSYEGFTPYEGDVAPAATIHHLEALSALLA